MAAIAITPAMPRKMTIGRYSRRRSVDAVIGLDPQSGRVPPSGYAREPCGIRAAANPGHPRSPQPASKRHPVAALPVPVLKNGAPGKWRE